MSPPHGHSFQCLTCGEVFDASNTDRGTLNEMRIRARSSDGDELAGIICDDCRRKEMGPFAKEETP
jgi:hypothetical protein